MRLPKTSRSFKECSVNDKEITLRDYFANSAMQAMITGMFTSDKEGDSPDRILERFRIVSKNAYWFADEMLKQKEK